MKGGGSKWTNRGLPEPKLNQSKAALKPGIMYVSLAEGTSWSDWYMPLDVFLAGSCNKNVNGCIEGNVKGTNLIRIPWQPGPGQPSNVSEKFRRTMDTFRSTLKSMSEKDGDLLNFGFGGKTRLFLVMRSVNDNKSEGYEYHEVATKNEWAGSNPYTAVLRTADAAGDILSTAAQTVSGTTDALMNPNYMSDLDINAIGGGRKSRRKGKSRRKVR